MGAGISRQPVVYQAPTQSTWLQFLMLEDITRVIVFLLIIGLLSGVVYVFWFAFTNGIQGFFLSQVDTVENQIKDMITVAVDRANMLGGLIVGEYKNIEGKLIGAYNTVANKLVETAGIIQKEGDNAIYKIKNEGEKTISNIETTYNNVVNTITNKSKEVIEIIKSESNKIIDESKKIIERVKREGDSAVDEIKREYNKIQRTLEDTSNKVSTESQALINNIKTETLSAYEMISREITKSYVIVEDKSIKFIEDLKSTALILASETTKTIDIIKTDGQNAINKIDSETSKIIKIIEDGSIKLANQIAADATGVANQVAAGATGVANQVATGATGVANQVAAGATGVANQVAAGATGVANQVAAGATGVANQVATGATGVANQVATGATGAANQVAAGATGAANQVATGATKFGGEIAGFQNPSSNKGNVSVLHSPLINIQALSIKDTGFLGPYPRGSYKEDIATANALKAGARFLTLYIDYMDTKMDASLFEAPGFPTLLVRDSAGSLLSRNSGSISEVMTAIENNGFNPIVPNNNLPILLYLHILRSPNATNNPEAYISFLSKIADELNPIAPYHLGLTPSGNFTRQKMAEELLTMPLTYLSGKIIILSNAETSMFRRKSIDRNLYPPAKDLDFWVNMRVYLDEASDLNGITELADKDIQPSAVLVSLNRILSLSTANKALFSKSGKKRFVIAMGDRTRNPSPEAISTALNTLGVNAIPIDIFTPEDSEIRSISNEYGNSTFRQKPDNLQYIS